ncbi:hypothetical protein ACOMHN_064844 [Nucella lapillus]
MAARPQSHDTTSSNSGEQSHGAAAHHEWGAFRGPVLFTGPSGLRDYRAKMSDHPGAVGIGDRSHETTSNRAGTGCKKAHYRGAPGSAFPLAKNGRIGEIGWPVETFKIVKGI